MSTERKAITYRPTERAEMLLQKLQRAKGLDTPGDVITQALEDSWRDHDLLERARKVRATIEAETPGKAARQAARQT